MRRVPAIAAVGAAAAAALVPVPAVAHGLTSLYDAPLPLVVYVAGAAVAVGLSFVFAMLSTGTWTPRTPERTRRVPRLVVLALRALGLGAWLWVMAQLVVGGSSAAVVGSLFTWVYGWVGLAIVCAVLGPVWSWLDPFTTLHELGGVVARRLRLPERETLTLPAGTASIPPIR